MNSAQQTKITALRAAQEPQGVTFRQIENADSSVTLLATPPTGKGVVQIHVSADGAITNRGWLVC